MAWNGKNGVQAGDVGGGWGGAVVVVVVVVVEVVVVVVVVVVVELAVRVVDLKVVQVDGNQGKLYYLCSQLLHLGRNSSEVRGSPPHPSHMPKQQNSKNKGGGYPPC